MAPKSLTVWLADYIWEEISLALTWKRDTSRGIKPDPDGRFNDDGSNFRSISSPPEGSHVQLLHLVAAEHVIMGYVSDGITKVKAQFSDDAVATFEEAIDGPLDLGVTNDVFEIKRLTVISTPFGPADGFVQLCIEEILYKHHLRQVVGVPSPIQDNENIRLLIEDIKIIRVPHIKEEPDDHTETAPAFSPRPPPNTIDHDEGTQPHQVPRTQVQRRTEPSLVRDGYEIERGDNLAQPVNANRLLELMKGRGPIAKSMPSSAVRARKQSPPPSPPAQKPVSVASGDGADTKMRDASPGPSGPPRSYPPSTAVVIETPVRPQTSRPNNINYGRRKIPDNQKKLLESASSWHPPLPGRTPVHPNVPIELLKQWNAEASAKARNVTTLQPASAPTPKKAQHDDTVESSSNSSESSAASEQQIPEEDWPASQSICSPTQSPAKPLAKRVPPPSSATDNLEIVAPQTLPPRAPRALRERVSQTSPPKAPRAEREREREKQKPSQRQPSVAHHSLPPKPPRPEQQAHPPTEPKAWRSPAQVDRYRPQYSPGERQRRDRDEFFERDRRQERESKQSRR